MTSNKVVTVYVLMWESAITVVWNNIKDVNTLLLIRKTCFFAKEKKTWVYCLSSFNIYYVKIVSVCKSNFVAWTQNVIEGLTKKSNHRLEMEFIFPKQTYTKTNYLNFSIYFISPFHCLTLLSVLWPMKLHVLVMQYELDIETPVTHLKFWI